MDEQCQPQCASRSRQRTEREVAQALDLQDRLEVYRQERQEVEHHLNARRELDLVQDFDRQRMESVELPEHLRNNRLMRLPALPTC